MGGEWQAGEEAEEGEGEEGKGAQVQAGAGGHAQGEGHGEKVESNLKRPQKVLQDPWTVQFTFGWQIIVMFKLYLKGLTVNVAILCYCRSRDQRLYQDQ